VRAENCVWRQLNRKAPSDTSVNAKTVMIPQILCCCSDIKICNCTVKEFTSYH
jgi:hypothetical protein